MHASAICTGRRYVVGFWTFLSKMILTTFIAARNLATETLLSIRSSVFGLYLNFNYTRKIFFNWLLFESYTKTNWIHKPSLSFLYMRCPPGCESPGHENLTSVAICHFIIGLPHLLFQPRRIHIVIYLHVSVRLPRIAIYNFRTRFF